MTSGEIIHLLAAKHINDVFVPECKNGATWTGSHIRLDAWTMNRSWAHLCMTGYEVKVSRSDFMNDKKWPGYLNLCHELYFVTPKGIIQKDELPAEVGLMEVAGTGRVLITRKKAQHRSIDPPAELLVYILMCRTKIQRDDRDRDNSVRWREWLAQKKENRNLGYDVSRAIRDHVSKVECENLRLRKVNESLEDAKILVKQLGLDADFFNRYSFEHRVRELTAIVPDELRYQVQSSIQALTTLKIEMDRITNQKAA